MFTKKVNQTCSTCFCYHGISVGECRFFPTFQEVRPYDWCYQWREHPDALEEEEQLNWAIDEAIDFMNAYHTRATDSERKALAILSRRRRRNDT